MSVLVQELVKAYDNGIKALDTVTMHLPPGTTGLLGPNGAGKTTCMRILATLLDPTSGEGEVYGIPLRDKLSVREILGYLPQSFGFYPQLSVRETLTYFSHLKGTDKRRVDELLEVVGLDQAAKRKVHGLSGGMRQRLGIAVALLNDPRFLIVDEPTSGLDPEARIQFRRLLSTLPGERTVLLSTHIAEDVAQTAANVFVLVGGRVRFSGTPDELASVAEGRVWQAEIPLDDLPEVEKTHQITASVRNGNQLKIRSIGPTRAGFAPLAPTLEDGYMALLRGEALA